MLTFNNSDLIYLQKTKVNIISFNMIATRLDVRTNINELQTVKTSFIFHREEEENTLYIYALITKDDD